MSTATRRTDLEWSQECAYISRVTDLRGKVPEMNRSRAVFLRYCEMQKSIATREARFDAETYIQHCIDDLS